MMHLIPYKVACWIINPLFIVGSFIGVIKLKLFLGGWTSTKSQLRCPGCNVKFVVRDKVESSVAQVPAMKRFDSV